MLNLCDVGDTYRESFMASGTTTDGCEFSSFSSGSKVRARSEMPTSGPGGVSAGEGLFRWSPFPAEKVVVFAPARF